MAPWLIDGNSLVGANTGSLKSLRAQLLVLVGDEVDAQREVIDVGTLATQVEDANLGVGDTTVEARLGVRLFGTKNVSLGVFCESVEVLRIAHFNCSRTRKT